VLFCCLCGEEITNGHGNNAKPVGPGRCCDGCDRDIVTPHRLNPPKVSPEEELDRLSKVERVLDDLVSTYSGIVHSLEEKARRRVSPDLPREEAVFWAGEVARTLGRAEGLLAAIKLAHGLVAGGEDEDLARESFPDFDP
jgi:hypothetical protein